MNVLTLDSVCQFCLNEQLEMRNEKWMQRLRRRIPLHPFNPEP